MKTERETYYEQQLGDVWSFARYQEAYEGVFWDWHVLPFSDDHYRIRPGRFAQWQVWPGSHAAGKSRLGFRYSPDVPVGRIEGKSILEVGAAMGAAYGFLKSTGKIDLSRYTGLEVSDMGHRRARERFPEARWMQADFTRHDLQERFDYSFERHAVHHMPDPVAQYEKMARQTDVAMNCVFVGRMDGPTVSDLTLGQYRNADKGVCYFNVINVFEVVAMGLRLGYKHIRVCYYGDHESCPTDPAAEQYLAASVQAAGVQRFMVRMNRCPTWARPVVYGFAWRPSLLFSGNLRKLRAGLARLVAAQ